MSFLLITLYSLLFTFLSWRRLPVAIAILLFALPSYLIRFSIGPIPMTLLEGMLLIIVAVWLVKKLREGGMRRLFLPLLLIPQSLRLPIMLFVFASIISVFIAPDMRAAVGLWRAYIIEPILFLIVFVDLYKENNFPKNILWIAITASAFIISALAIFQHYTGWMIPETWAPLAVRRTTSIFPFPNAVGLYLAPIIPLLIGWGMVAATQKRWLTTFIPWIVAILASAAIITAQSDGAIVALGIGFIFFGFFHTRWMRGVTTLVLCVFFITLMSVSRWQQPHIRKVTLHDESGPVRIAQWASAARMLQDHPILGVGLSGYKTSIAPYHTQRQYEIFQYPHNIVLNIWSELGILGLLSFFWIIAFFFRRGAHALRTTQTSRAWILALLTSMLIILVHGIVDVPYFKNDLALFFWFLVGLMITETQRRKENFS